MEGERERCGMRRERDVSRDERERFMGRGM